jgi:hypothetical protein
MLKPESIVRRLRLYRHWSRDAVVDDFKLDAET